MKKLMKKLDSSLGMAKIKAMSFLADQRGDTNFISIAIILIIVIAIAVIFIGFGQKLATGLQQKVNEILSKLGI